MKSPSAKRARPMANGNGTAGSGDRVRTHWPTVAWMCGLVSTIGAGFGWVHTSLILPPILAASDERARTMDDELSDDLEVQFSAMLAAERDRWIQAMRSHENNPHKGAVPSGEFQMMKSQLETIREEQRLVKGRVDEVLRNLGSIEGQLRILADKK